MHRQELLRKIEDAIWKNGGCQSNIQPDDLESAAIAALDVIADVVSGIISGDNDVSTT